MTKLHLYNTLTRKLEEFKPLNPPNVTMYTCGPTVYDFAHIGNLKAYTSSDLLYRTLIYFGYNVHSVMNVTDVGQLESDEDFGEDKIMIGVARERAKGHKITVWDLVKKYKEKFVADTRAMNMIPPVNLAAATEHIPEMINLVQKLVDKGLAYVTSQAVYYDVSKFPTYTELSRQKLEEKKDRVREELVSDPNKKSPYDFRVWQLDRPDHAMLWDSPWGKGFPGWHIECSAMSMKYLGETIDIHLGGIDHIPVHHTNEIAQSEGATGKQFVRHWMHSAFLKIDGTKMSKSKNNFYSLDDVIKKGFDPLDLRYFYLEAQYRIPQNFTWKGMSAAKNARMKINEQIQILRTEVYLQKLDLDESYDNALISEFDDFLASDLNIPGALSVLWKVIRSKMLAENEKLVLLFRFDKVLGLRLEEVKSVYEVLSKKDMEEVLDLVKRRELAKENKDFVEADELRKDLTEKGFRLMDTTQRTYTLFA